MASPDDTTRSFRRTFVLGLTLVVCVVFAALIRNYLVAVLMAAPIASARASAAAPAVEAGNSLAIFLRCLRRTPAGA